MGKRGGGKSRVSNGIATTSYGLKTCLSLRETASGKKLSHSAKSLLKLQHLQHLAEWSAGVALIPSLGAFFGRRFAEFGEALGISPDRSLFPCQRCETLLHPSFNCNVQIEKNRSKRRRRGSKSNPPPQNIVVYTCDFCLHRNLKRGTPKGYMRQIAPPKAKPCLKTKAGDSTAQESRDTEKSNANKLETPSTLMSTPSASFTNSPTPLATTGAKLLDSKRRLRKKPGSKGSMDESLVSSTPAEAEKAGGTSKKRKKSWTSLREIAANEEHEKNQRFKNISIPFVM